MILEIILVDTSWLLLVHKVKVVFILWYKLVERLKVRVLTIKHRVEFHFRINVVSHDRLGFFFDGIHKVSFLFFFFDLSFLLVFRFLT